MKNKIFLTAALFFFSVTIGVVAGRRWQGTWADIVLSVIVLVAVCLVAFAALTFLLPRLGQINLVGKHWAIERREGKLVLRLEDFGRIKTAEFAIALPKPPRFEWRGWRAQRDEPPEPPLLPMLTVVRQSISEQPWRLALFLSACALTLSIWFQVPGMPDSADYTIVTWSWIATFILFTFAVAPPRARPRFDLWAWSRVHWRTAIAVAGITIVGTVLRVWEIGTIPFTLAGDEASFGSEALRVLRGELGNPFSTGWLTQPTLSFFYNSVTIRFLGPTQAALRLPWAWMGIVTVPITFWLTARLKGVYLGLITATLLAAYHFHIHFSRLSLNNIVDPLSLALAFLFFYRAVTRHSPLDWVFTGAVCGAALYFYQGARLAPLVVAAVVVYLMVYDRRRFWRENRLGLFIALGAFFFVAAPMLQYAIRFPDAFNARMNQMGIVQSGWLEREPAIRGTSTAMVLVDQFLRAALAFNFYPDRSVWYGLREPLLDPLFGALFLLGLGYATIRSLVPGGDRRFFPMVAWWWSGMLLGGMLTLAPPASMRLITLAVPVCFFIALAMWQLVRVAKRAVTGVPAGALLIAGVLLFSVIGLKMYFVDFTPQRITGGEHAEISTAIAPILNDLGPSDRAYFFATPNMDSRFPTLLFFVPDVQSADVMNPLTAPPPSNWLEPGRRGIFVFLPHRLGEMALVQKTFSDGAVREIRRPSDQQVIVTLYQVPP